MLVEKKAGFHMAACFLGAAGAALGFGPSVSGSAGHLGTCASPGDREAPEVSWCWSTAAPGHGRRTLLWFESHCGGLEHPVLLLQSRSGDVCLEQKAFLLLLVCEGRKFRLCLSAQLC